MRDPITTTANRVRKGGYWCEDATAITQAALDKDGLDWDTEIPVSWGFDNLGLANTILALGSVNPRFQPRANVIIIDLMRNLYHNATVLGKLVDFTFVNTGHWLGNPDRASSCKAQHEMWKELARDMSDPASRSIASALTILFSADPPHIACLHASKLLLLATKQLRGDTAAAEARQHIITSLRQELEA